MVKRSRTHVVDTLAVREIISCLPEDCLVRGMEERDYGIDLSIEIFEGENPTGRIALIQVKGKDSHFDNPVKLSFPTKTIEYSLLFQEPFFIFHTSITEKKTFFIWAQKYTTTRLDIDNPDWKSQDSVTVYFPDENKLKENFSKISEIMSLSSVRNEGLEFLAAYEWFKVHWQGFKSGEVELIDACLEDLNRIYKYDIFLPVYMKKVDGIDLSEIEYCLEELKIRVLEKSGQAKEINDFVFSVDSQLEVLDLLKWTFLDNSDMDKFYVEHSDYCPY